MYTYLHICHLPIYWLYIWLFSYLYEFTKLTDKALKKKKTLIQAERFAEISFTFYPILSSIPEPHPVLGSLPPAAPPERPAQAKMERMFSSFPSG